MMEENSLTELDFDAAMELARTDPDAFEQYRQDVIEALIARAPERNQQHLRRLQWRIEQERKRASNPMSACVKLYRMMWESFAGECGLIDTLQNTRNSARSMQSLRPRAKVVSLPRTVATESSSEP
jgi:hypothetical protein